MARISKKGLDYFPMDTHFMQDRAVRRLMKQEGDNALSILLAVYSYLYDGEGYYLKIDKESFEDIAATFYNITAEQVIRVVEASVRIGLFDRRLYTERGILTSAAIQRQYLFVKKRAAGRMIFPEFSLLVEEEENEKQPLFADDEAVKPGDKEPLADGIPVKRGKTAAKSAQRKEKESIAKQNKEKDHLLLNPPPSQGEERTEKREEPSLSISSAENDLMSLLSEPVGGCANCKETPPQEVEDKILSPVDGKPADSLKNGVQQSVSQIFTVGGDAVDPAKDSTQPPTSSSSVESGNHTELTGESSAACKDAVSLPQKPSSSAPEGKKRVRKTWTLSEILSLEPPLDGVKRNYAGLLESLREYSVSPDEQYAIIRKSNFGAIGHPVWKGFYTLRGCGGKIKLPGRYLLSL